MSRLLLIAVQTDCDNGLLKIDSVIWHDVWKGCSVSKFVSHKSVFDWILLALWYIPVAYPTTCDGFVRIPTPTATLPIS